MAGVRDVVPTFRSVTVYVDPLHTDCDGLLTTLDEESRRPPPAPSISPAPIRIPVCYGGDLGPDLADVAAFAGASERDVVNRHAARVYRVFALGFVAGFAYLGTVDDTIAMPRLATPRVRVPAGSVGIAGIQTGIYPIETPGGWRLIGPTPVQTFDLEPHDPVLMQTGDAEQLLNIGLVEIPLTDREAS